MEITGHLHEHRRRHHAHGMPRVVSLAGCIRVLPCQGLSKGRALVDQCVVCHRRRHVWSTPVGYFKQVCISAQG